MSDKLVVVAVDEISASGLAPLTSDDRFEVVLASGWDTEQFHEVMARAHGLIVRSDTKVTRELLDVSPNLRVVGRAGVGVDNIDLGVATAAGIPVINAPEGNTVSAAELASRARAFGMRTIAHDPYLTEERAEELGVERVEFADALLQGDVVSLHVPLTPATEGMIGRKELQAMKPMAILINAARGGVVDEHALVAALEAEEIAGAALDVYETEPLPEGSPLPSAPNLVLTPHLGASTAEAQELVASEIAEGVRAALLEGDLSRALNAPAIGGEHLKIVRPLLNLAGKIGRIAAVLGAGGMRRVDVRLAAETDVILRPVSAAVMTGMLSPVVGSRNVNYVNALHLAESRNITVATGLLERRPDYSEYLEVVLETERDRVRVCGALLGDKLHPRIVQIDGFPLSVKPEGCLVVLRNKDVPGVIGKVGTLFGTHGLNIAEYMQARTNKGGQALAAITVDGNVGSSILAALREEDEIFDARAVLLGD